MVSLPEFLKSDCVIDFIDSIVTIDREALYTRLLNWSSRLTNELSAASIFEIVNVRKKTVAKNNFDTVLKSLIAVINMQNSLLSEIR